MATTFETERPQVQEVERSVRISLLGRFAVTRRGEQIEIPPIAQRLVALMALRPAPLTRPYVAGTLWPDVPERRANASLRSALWRLGSLRSVLVRDMRGVLQLGAAARVDIWEADALARRVADPATELRPGDVERAAALCVDLLPGWYEEWTLLERERVRQVGLRTLERLCERLAQRGHHAEAVRAGLLAVAGEPLRESAHRALIGAHVAEGNRSDALRQYRTFRETLARELGLAPSPLMEELVASLRSH